MSQKETQQTHHASLSPDTLDRIADLVVAKLRAQTPFPLLPKHDVAGSNPVTRSIRHKPTSCLIINSCTNVISRYEVAARAAGFSHATIRHTVRYVRYFARFVGEKRPVSHISLDEHRAFIGNLRERRVWQGMSYERPRLLSGSSINTCDG